MTPFVSDCRMRLVALLTSRLSDKGTVETEAVFDERGAGYKPKADLKLRTLGSGPRRSVWVELEYRRADPIANPAKFLVAFEGRGDRANHILVCALSNGIQRGRRQVCEDLVAYIDRNGIMGRAITLELLEGLNGDEVVQLSCAKSQELDAVLSIGDRRDRVERSLSSLANRLVELLLDQASEANQTELSP